MRLLVCLLLTMPTVASQNTAAVVEMLVPPVASPSMSIAFLRAHKTVEDVFSAIGVEVEWGLPRSPSAGCSKEPMRRTILVAFSENTPATFHNQALAVARPYSNGGACITVFIDRLRPMVFRNPATAASLLGYVLAHEVGHVLQGISRHSDSGVLKEHWSLTEFDRMRNETLRFTPYDAVMILRGFRGLPDPGPGAAF